MLSNEGNLQRERHDDLPPPYTPQAIYPEQQISSDFQQFSPPPKYSSIVTTQPGYYGATALQFPVTHDFITRGGCPICRIGRLEDFYTCLGITCAIFCFPFGIIPCFMTRYTICTNCGAQIH